MQQDDSDTYDNNFNLDSDEDDDFNVPLSSLAVSSVPASNTTDSTTNTTVVQASVDDERLNYHDVQTLFQGAFTATNNSQRLIKMLAGVLTATTNLMTGATDINEIQTMDFVAIIANGCATLRPSARSGSNGQANTNTRLVAQPAAAPTRGRPLKGRIASSTERAGPAKRNAKPARACSFCSSTDHVITKCNMFRRYGSKPNDDPATILRCLLDCEDRLYPLGCYLSTLQWGL
jgi:hypothetical protein